MALQKLTARDLAGPTKVKKTSEYHDFLQKCRVGQGGKEIVSSDGVSRQSIKNRLNKAASDLGITLKYHRSGAGEVVFEVVSKS